MSELPYEIVTPPGWIDSVDSWDWTWTMDDEGRAVAADKRGLCPRCLHPMNIPIGIVEGLVAGATTSDESCNCSIVHSPGRQGCGAHGRIDVPSTPS